MNLKHLKYAYMALCALVALMGQLGLAQETYVYTQARTENGARDLRLDLYPASPTCEMGRPTLVFVHPGAFRAGSRKDILVRQFRSIFQPHGFNVVSIDHRLIHHRPILSPDYAFVAQQFSAGGVINQGTNAAAAVFEDTVAALTYLNWHASDLCIDPNKIVLAGASSGAIVVLNVAYSLDAYGIEVPPLAGVVDLWGGFMPDKAMNSSDIPIFLFMEKGTA